MTLRQWLAACAVATGLFLPLAVLVAAAHAGCQTRACWKRVHAARAEQWLKRHRPAVYWYRREPASWRAWSRATAWCESNRRWHIATGNGFYGGLQFTAQTWFAAQSLIPRAARTSRLPHLERAELQSLVAIRYARRYGTGAWPSCG